MVKEIILGKNKIALVDDEDYERVNQLKWYIGGNGINQYARTGIWISPTIPKKTIYMHRFIMNPKPWEQVDHINGNGLDNRRCNLRIATQSQNLMNGRKHVGLSQYKGVSWNKKYKKWQSLIYINKKLYHLGYFIDEKEAAKTYDITAKKYFGEYARLNFP